MKILRLRSHFCPILKRHGLAGAGMTEPGRSWYFAQESHPAVSVVVCERGQAEVWGGACWRKLTAGNSYVTAPGYPWGMRNVRGQPLELVWAEYTPGAVTLPAVLAAGPMIEPADAGALRHAFLGLYGEFHGTRDPESLDLWVALLHRSASRLLHAEQTGYRLTRLWRKVEQQLAHPWTLTELAREAGMCKESLRLVSVQERGMTPLRYVARLRLEYAAELLEASGTTVGEAGRQVGYENPAAFIQAFKVLHGRTPAQHARASRNPAGL